jgi:hypothetical protein
MEIKTAANNRLAQAVAVSNFQLFQAIIVGSVRTVRTFNALPDASLQPLAVMFKNLIYGRLYIIEI